MEISNTPTLRESLTYEPKTLQFGTSGRRGEVVHLTQLEIFINALAELEFLLELPNAEGGIIKGDPFFYARDLRPSSSEFVAERQGRGELAQVIELAIRQAGMIPVNQGRIPTPALTYVAVSQGKGSIMVTGSHIPFDRNGYKTNTSIGELLKRHEQPINDKVLEVRKRLYDQPFAESIFNADGMLKAGSQPLSNEKQDAALCYQKRYEDFFGSSALAGLKLLVYQHSAVGRDMLASILKALGAEVVAAGRSEIFVPIDTENMDDAQMAVIQQLYDEAANQHGCFDAIVSTDGDSDRPLLLGIDPATAAVKFFGGDLIGMITAEYLGADAVVVPISCNDGIDRSDLQSLLEPKTRIGSPFVIAGMETALAKGKQAVCGWEANGGFLTGSDLLKDGRPLRALPTRDAILPIVAVLTRAREEGLPLTALFSRLPKRYSRAALIKQFPRATALAMVKRLSPSSDAIRFVEFQDKTVELYAGNGQPVKARIEEIQTMTTIKTLLESVFSPELGYSPIHRIDYTDGVRIGFVNGDIAHLRPSGNADELRIYAVADTQIRADHMAASAVTEPDGLLRKLAEKLA